MGMRTRTSCLDRSVCTIRRTSGPEMYRSRDRGPTKVKMKYLMLCPVLLSSLGAIAQVSVKNVDLVEGAPNVLYESWDNKVQILGLDSADLRDLTTSNGTISRSNNGWNTFTIRCKTDRKSTRLNSSHVKI